VGEFTARRYFQQFSFNARIGDPACTDFTPDQDHPSGDHYLHAPGQICHECGRVIEAGQTARRRGETGCVHDECPPREDS